MDAKDYQIIQALQEDGRLSNQALSEMVNLSPSPCLRRTRLLEESGAIIGYTAIVDEVAYGLPITAFVKIRLQRHDRKHSETIEQAIRDIDAVQDCYMMTGEADYLLRVLVGSLTEYEEFVRDKLHDVPGISAIDTSFAIGTVKRTTRFPKRRYAETRSIVT